MRTCERHEQQFSETAAAEGESQKPPVRSPGDKVKSGSVTANMRKMTFQRRNNRRGNVKPKKDCFKCGDLNYIM